MHFDELHSNLIFKRFLYRCIWQWKICHNLKTKFVIKKTIKESCEINVGTAVSSHCIFIAPRLILLLFVWFLWRFFQDLKCKHYHNGRPKSRHQECRYVRWNATRCNWMRNTSPWKVSVWVGSTWIIGQIFSDTTLKKILRHSSRKNLTKNTIPLGIASLDEILVHMLLMKQSTLFTFI